MTDSVVVIDWTVVATIVGVVFAVVIAVATALLGNMTLGKYQLKIRKYELFFEKKCLVYTEFMDFSSRLWALQDVKVALGPEFESLCHRVRLFASKDTGKAVINLRHGLTVWANASFEKDGVPNVIQLFSDVIDLMQCELADDSGAIS